MLKGFAMHCHHSILAEYCYDYEERVEAIKRDKPPAEQEIRLRLFKILPKEALKDIPIRLQKADAEWEKVDAEWEKAYAKWEKARAELAKADAELAKADAEYKKAYAEYKKAIAEYRKANAEWDKAYAKWEKADQEIFHKKWCGCSYWKNGEINFD